MNKGYIEGFIKKAQENGISVQAAKQMLKDAGMDPAAMAAAGGAGGPPPGGSPTGDPSAGGMAGGPPPGGPGGDPSQGGGAGGGGMGVPPELEQMLSQLPPDVLAQVLQEIQAELSGAGGGGAPGGDPSQGGGDPSMGGAGGPPPQGAGGPPPGGHHKSGGERIWAKEAGYIEGFMEQGLRRGYNLQVTKELYKKALETIEQQQRGPSYQAPTKKVDEKRAAHYEGFMEKAAQVGISPQEAHNAYLETFSK